MWQLMKIFILLLINVGLPINCALKVGYPKNGALEMVQKLNDTKWGFMENSLEYPYGRTGWFSFKNPGATKMDEKKDSLFEMKMSSTVRSAVDENQNMSKTFASGNIAGNSRSLRNILAQNKIISLLSAENKELSGVYIEENAEKSDIENEMKNFVGIIRLKPRTVTTEKNYDSQNMQRLKREYDHSLPIQINQKTNIGKTEYPYESISKDRGIDHPKSRVKRFPRTCKNDLYTNAFLKNAGVNCTAWPDLLQCVFYCTRGYAMQENGSSVLETTRNCRESDPYWYPEGFFPKCKPYINCKTKMIRPGHINCKSSALERPYCDISCHAYSEFEEVPKKRYECLDDNYNGTLPHCAVLDDAVKLIGHPNKHLTDTAKVLHYTHEKKNENRPSQSVVNSDGKSEKTLPYTAVDNGTAKPMWNPVSRKQFDGKSEKTLPYTAVANDTAKPTRSPVFRKQFGTNGNFSKTLPFTTVVINIKEHPKIQ